MRLLALLLLAVLVAACAEAPPEAPPAPAQTVAEDAPCPEHGVLAAVCTKCNPALAPIFQAKGDWCAEHGFPESFCPACRPEAGGRPGVDVSTDEAPADGTRVRFLSPAGVEAAGIRTASAAEAAALVEITVPARIVPDATRHAEINARAPGVVRELRAEVGSTVAAGDALAVIESAEVGQFQSRLQSARARLDQARAAVEREEDLHRRGISAQREVLAARRELEEATAEDRAARSALSMVGSTDGSSYVMRAPLSGTILRRGASPGRLVHEDEVLFEIVDTSRVWARLDVPEAELDRVATGQAVVLTLPGITDRRYEGRIEAIAPEVDPVTRTAAARVVLGNEDGLLRANMLGEARIALDEHHDGVVVPREAVQRASDVQLVFVRTAEDAFEVRRVKAGESHGDHVEIVTGLEPGELVATQGSFLLKTEVLKSAIGSGCCAVE